MPRPRPSHRNMHSGISFLAVVTALLAPALLLAQEPAPATPPAIAPPSTPLTTTPGSNVTPAAAKAPLIWPTEIEDGGFSVDVSYWVPLNAHPSIRAGAASTDTNPPFLDFPGKEKGIPEITVSVPAGKGNSIRVSYFRGKGSGNTTLGSATDLFTVGYSTGDYLNTTYTIDNLRASWDFLSYTFLASHIRVKTLWEVQYTSIYSDTIAPLKTAVTNSDGTVNNWEGNGTKRVILPTLGAGFEQALGNHFRWEVEGSGFGIPHRAGTYNGEGALSLRVGHVEASVGAKTFYVKTSAKGDYDYREQLNGGFVRLRWYLERSRPEGTKQP